MHTESKENWSSWLANKSPREQAEQIIAKLIGYRSKSVYREMDVHDLATAIEAIRASEDIRK